jgi:hypothetical protein
MSVFDTARALYDKGKPSAAQALLEMVLAKREAELGRDHPELGPLFFLLGAPMSSQGGFRGSVGPGL